MKKALVVVDMQNDFVDGALANEMAVRIVPLVREKIRAARKDHLLIFTRDTHQNDYMDTEEGKNLPVAHCLEGTEGWEIVDALADLAKEADEVIDKETFGSSRLLEFLRQRPEIEEIELIGLCTDICVISNALLAKAALPDAHVKVDARCCAGVTAASHDTALSAMRACHVEVLGQGEEPWR